MSQKCNNVEWDSDLTEEIVKMCEEVKRSYEAEKSQTGNGRDIPEVVPTEPSNQAG